jgi:deoxyhypusine synthase
MVPGHEQGGMPATMDEKHPGLGPVGRFVERNFRHFNAATTHEAAEAYADLIDRGGKMFLAMAGAMSTGELGISLAEMIRREKVHAICCTGANLEEDVFNLVAHSKYLRLPAYRDLTPEDEEAILDAELARVTDTCIPERDAMNKIEDIVKEYWHEADENEESYFPHEYLYRCLKEGALDDEFDIDPRDSWMVAAAERDLPIFVPGWGDSTLGNMFASLCVKGDIKDSHCVKGDIDYMVELCFWYKKTAKGAGIGFFQIGGGIAGDFPICVVPLLRNDLRDEDTPLWSYFCQISDSTTSFGSYSGAVPNEKITWEKLGKETPRFVIESDAAIVAPLIFAYVLGQ